MLDLQQIAQQLSALAERERPEFDRLREARLQAQEALEWHNDVWRERPEDELSKKVSWLVCRPSEPPADSWSAPQRPSPLTAVATDGSQIYPDPHYTLGCCLINVSRIAFQYGTTEKPDMNAVTRVAIREIPQIRAPMTAQLVTAWRDQTELEVLLETARSAGRHERPLVAIADGTLIRWMLQGIESKGIEEHFVGKFTALLAEFRRERIPICAYTSLPNATEVVNLLRLVSANDNLAGLRDREVFASRLKTGFRSALFESSSHIKKSYSTKDQVFFFYVCVDGDIGRVEIPRWIAEERDKVDLIHAFVVSECAKGNGYPMILTEAHERAVVRAGERDNFYYLLERELGKSGVHLMQSPKAQSKRRPVI